MSNESKIIIGNAVYRPTSQWQYHAPILIWNNNYISPLILDQKPVDYNRLTINSVTRTAYFQP